MTHEPTTLQVIIDFCNGKFVEADQASPSGFPTADMLTGKKMAYNEVFQFVRKLMAERDG